MVFNTRVKKKRKFLKIHVLPEGQEISVLLHKRIEMFIIIRLHLDKKTANSVKGVKLNGV